ncbi:MAG: GNAT family N-acetyltransferase [Bdellovibrionota bacterium]
MLENHEIESWFDLRLAALKDAPAAFLETVDEAKQFGFEPYLQRLIEGGKDNVLFGCWNREKIVGSVGVVKNTRKKLSHSAFIWGVYIMPDDRRKGIARMLMNQAIIYAKETMKVRVIHLSVAESQIAATQLYVSLGFEIWGRQPNAICVGDLVYHELHMSKQIP